MVITQDIHEISTEARRAANYCQASGRSMLYLPLCIEISLKTSEGDTMVLENWVLTMSDGTAGGTAGGGGHHHGTRLNNKIYNNMSLMLKSLLCATRSLPAYRLSRKQGPETFVICYRMSVGEPAGSLLGDGFQTAQVCL